MSLPAIRQALETQLATLDPFSTAFENVEFTPTAGVPYQAAYLLPAVPDNIEIGPGFLEQGIFQVNLFYPEGAGTGAVMARAELIRGAFPFAASLASGGVTVNITSTPEIGSARPDADRLMVPVRVRYSAYIGG